ncbi:MAG TPA: BrnA antitoxin family protein, partial [Thermoanaerobaculia bacterium]|nr:BrnA antitoxin family protein [Thermoanaerobaculia bacterium]
YDLAKLKVKRRGPLPAFREDAGRPMKVRITITLDQDLVDHFKAEAAKPGALPYQTQINQALRKAVTGEELRPEQAEALKAALLQDLDFLQAIARQLATRAARRTRGGV